jgi:hypothetical protein
VSRMGWNVTWPSRCVRSRSRAASCRLSPPIDRLATRGGGAAWRHGREHRRGAEAETAHPPNPSEVRGPGARRLVPLPRVGRVGTRTMGVTTDSHAARVLARHPSDRVVLRLSSRCAVGIRWPSAEGPLRSNASSTWSDTPAPLSALSREGVSAYPMSSILINSISTTSPMPACDNSTMSSRVIARARAPVRAITAIVTHTASRRLPTGRLRCGRGGRFILADRCKKRSGFFAPPGEGQGETTRPFL